MQMGAAGFYHVVCSTLLFTPITTFKTKSGSAWCKIPRMPLGGVGPRRLPAAGLALEEPIYNLEHLLRIPREDGVVWAAPRFNLASQLTLPDQSWRLSASAAAFTFAARQRASVRPLPSLRRSAPAVRAVINHAPNTPLSHGWVGAVCVCKQARCVLCCPSSLLKDFHSGCLCYTPAYVKVCPSVCVHCGVPLSGCLSDKSVHKAVFFLSLTVMMRSG